MRLWMKLFESRNDHIDIVEEYGSVEGYVTSDSTTIANWFMHRHDIYDQAAIEMVQGYERVAFLNNINVNEDARGHGHGSDLLRRFEAEAYDAGAEAIVLFADVMEGQLPGFDLLNWYKKHGYEEVEPEEGQFYVPLMVK